MWQKHVIYLTKEGKRKHDNLTNKFKHIINHTYTKNVNGYPLQCSCLENPREGGAWGAAVYGVTQSRTRLKHLSSSSSLPLKYRVFKLCMEFLKIKLYTIHNG